MLHLGDRVDVLNLDVTRSSKSDRRIVENRPDAGLDKRVSDLLGGRCGYSYDSQLDPLLLDLFLHSVAVLNDHVAHPGANTFMTDVKSSYDAITPAGDSLVTK